MSINGNSNISGFEYTSSNNIFSYDVDVTNYDGIISDFQWSLTQDQNNFFNLNSNGEATTLNWNNQITIGVYSVSISCNSETLKLEATKNININIQALPNPTINLPSNNSNWQNGEGYWYIGLTNNDFGWLTSNIPVSWSLTGQIPTWLNISQYGQLTIGDTTLVTAGEYSTSVKATSTQNSQKFSTLTLKIHLQSLPEPSNAITYGWTDLYGVKNTASTSTCEGIFKYNIVAPQYNSGAVVWQLARLTDQATIWDQNTGWNSGTNSGYTYLNPTVDTDGTLHVGWDDTITNGDRTFRVCLRPTPSYQTTWNKDITLHVMNQFDSVDHVDIDASGMSDFNVPITEGVSGSKQYTADVTHGLFHSKTNINQNVTWSLTGTNIPPWLSIDEYSGLLSWTNEAFKCQDENNPYTVSIVAASRQDNTKSYTKELKLKISDGDKTQILQTLINQINKLKPILINLWWLY